MEIPADEVEQKRILRSLFNIRMPGEISDGFLSVQDEYLREETRQKGITAFAGLTPAEPGIYLWKGDITTLACDAIVNAANSGMTGCYQPCHSCIDNCIRSFAGVQLRSECARQMSRLRAQYGPDYVQPTAVPMLTDGYNLPAKKVIHIVGPIVADTLTEQLERDLANCYKNTLDLCRENGLRSVAFCCISTGVFRFPGKRAAEIAVETVTDWLNAHPGAVARVIFNVFKDEDKAYYEQLLK
jgi:O-acetyl-ADP-ribose deacetylase (regulator of RNase III)